MVKHFIFIELDNNECPMVGIVGNIPNNRQGKESLRERAEQALMDYYDADVSFEMPDMFTGSPYEDMKVIVCDGKYTVRIMAAIIY